MKFSGGSPLQARGAVTELGLLMSMGMTPHSQVTEARYRSSEASSAGFHRNHWQVGRGSQGRRTYRGLWRLLTEQGIPRCRIGGHLRVTPFIKTTTKQEWRSRRWGATGPIKSHGPSLSFRIKSSFRSRTC